MSFPAGTRLGPYEIDTLIGEGGMGQVYRARDTRLDRTVAIKRLTVSHAHRFQTEARAVAALNHPHICQVYDIGEDYLVLEYVEGAHPSGPMAPAAVRDLAMQLAGALEAAHERGIFHRDLKPSNIIVTATGSAKLLDFGVAKRLGPEPDVTRTGEGLIVGTVAYMSPEQALGKPVDRRSDIFSFGAVLYELLAGRRAFDGETSTQVLSALLHDTPPPPDAPPSLQRIVMRCLAKQPADRFQSFGDVGRALEHPDQAALPTGKASIAVLPFADLSGNKDNEYFGDGLAEEIINVLAQVPGLKVIARTSAFAFKGRHEDVRRIAQALDVTHVLEGAVRRAGDRIRVTAQLIAALDGSPLWSDRYDRSMVDVFAVQDEMAGAITVALKGRLAPTAAPRAYTPAIPAYEAFLKGRHFLFKFTPDAWRRAQAHFEEAIALDPLYAEPHAELGLGYFINAMHGMRPMREVAAIAQAEAERALALNPGNPQPRVLLGAIALVYDYDWPSATAHFDASMHGAGVTADAHWIYASLYLSALGRFDEAIAEMGRAVEMDPLNATWRAVWAAHLINGGQLDRAIEQARKAVALEEHYFVPRFILGEAYLTAGRVEEALATLNEAYRLAPWNAMIVGLLAVALARSGDPARADALIAGLGDRPQPAFGRVWYHLFRHELDAAADWFDRMIDDRDPFALVYASAPVTQPLHAHPRWPALAARMRLPSQ